MTTDWTTASDEQILAADLILEQGLDELTIEEQQAVLENMNTAVEEAALAKALVRLDSADRAQLEQLIAAGEAEQVRSFLMAKLPDYDQLFQQMVILYKRVILTGERPRDQLSD